MSSSMEGVNMAELKKYMENQLIVRVIVEM